MASINTIPLFLEATSKEELTKKMLQNNSAHNAHFKYFDIQRDGKKWVVWFYAIVNPLENRILGAE